MTSPSDELRHQIECNTTNIGELGRYIRVEHVLSILDNFTIASDNTESTIQKTTLEQARSVLLDMSISDEHTALNALARILFQ